MHAVGNGIVAHLKKGVSLSIGGVVINLRGESSHLGVGLTPLYEPFRSSKPPDIKIVVSDRVPNFGNTRPFFRTRNAWKIIRTAQDRFFCMKGIAISYDHETSYGEIHINIVQRLGGCKIVYPLTTPLDQVLMATLLANRGGIITHAAGADIGGCGVLFVGASGAGKTTIARLLKEAKVAHVLSDDRIVTHRENGKFYISGTPWPGDLGVASSKMVPLKAMFFLRKARQNRIIPISSREIAPWLVARSFTPIWDRDAMGHSLKTCTDIAREVEGYVLEFKPDEELAEMVIQFSKHDLS